MLAKVFSSVIVGIDAHIVDVEVDIAHGLPRFTTVGLPAAAVRESKDRVKSALKNSGYTFPDDRITVNLAPAHLKKSGTGLDLPIALGILGALAVIPRAALCTSVLLGELSLDGRIKPVAGVLSVALEASRRGYHRIVVPHANRKEAAVVDGIDVLGASDLCQAVALLCGESAVRAETVDAASLLENVSSPGSDIALVQGQEYAKRALEVSAAGGHNLLMVGSPGAGKTLLARSMAGILPPLSIQEAIETTRIHSVAGILPKGQALACTRPFRAPHHTITQAGLIGGGSAPRPGEVSLATNGVLFLDELPEFKRTVLEVLRQPMETQHVHLARASQSVAFPARFMFVAAMNPCPCGYLSHPHRECRCSDTQIQRYHSRLSGPLLDRIDLHVAIPPVPYGDLAAPKYQEHSAVVARRVASARQRQVLRLDDTHRQCNAQMNPADIGLHCAVDGNGARLIERAAAKFGFSARAYFRILKIARTIADLDQSSKIKAHHVAEAIQYRSEAVLRVL